MDWVLEAKNLLGIDLNDAQIAQFVDFEALLLEWNARFNLTAIRDVEGIRIKHFLDSLTCVLAMEPGFENLNMIDVGTGAGFPGIPLKIVFPKADLTLVESIKKKAGFCEEAARVLGLRDVYVSSERVEALGQDFHHRQQYDLALARAVAGMPTLMEYLLPLVKVGGRVVVQKGSNALVELEEAKKAIEVLGGKVGGVVPVTLPGVEGDRYVIWIEKRQNTPAVYPRAIGVPSKTPIL